MWTVWTGGWGAIVESTSGFVSVWSFEKEMLLGLLLTVLGGGLLVHGFFEV